MTTAAQGRRSRQEVLRDFRTDQIVEAARGLIGRLGFAEASIDRIAEAAGVGRSTVYLYFDSKDAILQRCLAVGRERLLARVEESLEAAPGVEARLAALLGEILAHVDENRGFYRAVETLEGVGALGGEHAAPELEALGRAFEEILAGVFLRAVEEGELDPLDAAEAGPLLAALLHGAASRRAHRTAGGDPPEAEAARLARLFLYGISGKRE